MLDIHSCVFKPEAKFYPNNNRKENCHIGFELEIMFGNRDKFVNEFNLKFKDESKFYLKLDGSLNAKTGIEIVSQPMTLKYLINDNDLKYLYTLIYNNNGFIDEGCGLHFHLDKTYLSKNDIAIIDMFINTYNLYFEKIGGRTFNYYCERMLKNINDWGVCCGKRYVAVNLNNYNTVELRFCKSIIDYKQFIKTITMIFGLIEFVKQFKDIYSVYLWDCCKKSTFEDSFVEYIKKNYNIEER